MTLTRWMNLTANSGAYIQSVEMQYNMVLKVDVKVCGMNLTLSPVIHQVAWQLVYQSVSIQDEARI